MITIFEPKVHINKLWGEQPVKKNDTYRIMQYVLRADYEGQVLLHNVVSGQLVLLEQEEVEILNTLPQKYQTGMDQLIGSHYLVPEKHDEHQQVVGLKRIHRMLEEKYAEPGITSYTILPTTACNARCYYCFEQGCKAATMSKDTADQVVEFISKNLADDHRVFITWFGGEPTIASNRIDQICIGLKANNINYSSSMITNGYLFDEKMVNKAKDLWRLKYLQICVDGTEESYNKVKAYVGIKGSPYQRVMRNIGLLLDKQISVGLRMNYDIDNYQEFYDLCDEAYQRFGENEYLIVAAHAIIGEYKSPDGEVRHGSDDWFTDMQLQLNQKSRECGLLRSQKPLPYMSARLCGACKDSTAVITPDGAIVKCPEQFGDEQIIGHVKTGIVNTELIKEWKRVADYSMCSICTLFPVCTRLENCSNKTYCHTWKSFKQQYTQSMIKAYITYQKGEVFNGFQRAESGICQD